MPQWRKRVALKDLLSDDESDEATRRAAGEFAKRLKQLPEYAEQYELEEIVSEFEDIADPENDSEALAGRLMLCTYFNAVLDRLYDWADTERVWIEG